MNLHSCMRQYRRLGGSGNQTVYITSFDTDRLFGLVVKVSASRAEDPGFESRLRRDFFRGRVIPVT